MSRLTHWLRLRVNRISFDVAKTNRNKTILFRSCMLNKNYQKAKFLNKWSKNQKKNTNKILRSNIR